MIIVMILVLALLQTYLVDGQCHIVAPSPRGPSSLSIVLIMLDSAILSLCFHGYGSVYTRISSRFAVHCRWAPVGTVYYSLHSFTFIAFIDDSTANPILPPPSPREPPRALFIIYWVQSVFIWFIGELAFMHV